MWNKQTYHKLSYSLNEENAVLFRLNIRRNVSLRLVPVERSMQQFWNKYAGLRKLSFMRQNQQEKRQHMYKTENNSLAPTADTGIQALECIEGFVYKLQKLWKSRCFSSRNYYFGIQNASFHLGFCKAAKFSWLDQICEILILSNNLLLKSQAASVNQTKLNHMWLHNLKHLAYDRAHLLSLSGGMLKCCVLDYYWGQ